jgi:hypothetical protein
MLHEQIYCRKSTLILLGENQQINCRIQAAAAVAAA